MQASPVVLQLRRPMLRAAGGPILLPDKLYAWEMNNYGCGLISRAIVYHNNFVGRTRLR